MGYLTNLLVGLFLEDFFLVLLQKVIDGFFQELIKALILLSSQNFERSQKI